jgi:aquaporin Z
VGAIERLRAHWPEYLIEAWALGTFMISAGLVTTVVERSRLSALLPDPDLRRLLIGIGMGLTAIALIYSPWGKRSGAHMNPAVTLTFMRLRKVAPADGAFYMAAQFAGGVVGVLVVAALLGTSFTSAPINWVMTVPGGGGPWVAFAAELAISLGLMLVVLIVSNGPLSAYTGVFAGLLVAIYITVEAPWSGMSMNPARSFASAAPPGAWSHLWIYFTAPVLGMLAAAEIYVRALGAARVRCAKLQHPDDVRCIHCGYEPGAMRACATASVDLPGG